MLWGSLAHWALLANRASGTFSLTLFTSIWRASPAHAPFVLCFFGFCVIWFGFCFFLLSNIISKKIMLFWPHCHGSSENLRMSAPSSPWSKSVVWGQELKGTHLQWWTWRQLVLKLFTLNWQRSPPWNPDLSGVQAMTHGCFTCHPYSPWPNYLFTRVV